MNFLEAKSRLLAVDFTALASSSTESKEKYCSELELKAAAILMAVMNINGRAELLLTQRAAHLLLHPNEIAFPGGKPQPEDSGSVETALREAREEVYLPVESVKYLGQLNQRVTRSAYLLTPCVALVDCAVNLQANPEEVDNIFTVPLAWLLESANWQFTSQEYAGSQRLSPQFCFERYMVKGVTARLTADLMAKIFNLQLTHYD